MADQPDLKRSPVQDVQRSTSLSESAGKDGPSSPMDATRYRQLREAWYFLY